MNRKTLRFFLAGAGGLLLLFFFLIFRSKGTPAVFQKSWLRFDTVVNLTAYGKKAGPSLTPKIERELRKDQDLFGPSSPVLKQIAEDAGKRWTPVPESFFSLVEASLPYSRLSGGLFDLTIAPLVRLWGIGYGGNRVPSEREIREALKKIRYQDILLDRKNRRIRLKNPGMSIEPGSVSKGFITVRLLKLLRKEGISSALLDLGGNVYVLGHKPDGSEWRVGIQDPFRPRGQALGVLEASDTSVITSGVYERFILVNGKKYHHILDPRTGFPEDNNLMSVTVVTPDPVQGDALSTLFFLTGISETRRLLREHFPGLSVFFVTKDKKIYGLGPSVKKFTLLNSSFKMIDQNIS